MIAVLSYVSSEMSFLAGMAPEGEENPASGERSLDSPKGKIPLAVALVPGLSSAPDLAEALT